MNRSLRQMQRNANLKCVVTKKNASDLKILFFSWRKKTPNKNKNMPVHILYLSWSLPIFQCGIFKEGLRNYASNVPRAAVIWSWLKHHWCNGLVLMDGTKWQELLWGLVFFPEEPSFRSNPEPLPYDLIESRRSAQTQGTSPRSGRVPVTNATAWPRAAKSIPGAVSWCLSRPTEEVYITITRLSSAASASTAHLEALPCWATQGAGGGGE